jgi:AhpD family alkylhydroperoxidase
MIDWPQVTKDVSAQLRSLRADAPEVMKAFSSLAQAATVSKALDVKTKELIALGIAVAVRCDDCIAFHVKAALERGATKDEVTETLGMAIYMGARAVQRSILSQRGESEMQHTAAIVHPAAR